MWCIVTFLEDHQSVGIVRQSWLSVNLKDLNLEGPLTDIHCLYPWDKDTATINKLLRNQDKPSHSWREMYVNILKPNIESWEAALRASKKAEDTSNLDTTDSEDLGKHKRKHVPNSKFLSSESEEPSSKMKKQPGRQPLQSKNVSNRQNRPRSQSLKQDNLANNVKMAVDLLKHINFPSSSTNITRSPARIPSPIPHPKEKSLKSVAAPVQKSYSHNKPISHQNDKENLKPVLNHNPKNLNPKQNISSGVQKPKNPKPSSLVPSVHATIPDVQTRRPNLKVASASCNGNSNVALQKISSQLSTLTAKVETIANSSSRDRKKISALILSVDAMSKSLAEVTELVRQFIVQEIGQRNTEISSRFPLKSTADLILLEDDLNNDANLQNNMLNWFSRKNSGTLNASVVNVLKTMFSDELANCYSWLGFQRKDRLNQYTNVQILIFEAVRSKFPDSGDNDILVPLKRWLAHAKERLVTSGKWTSELDDDEDGDNAGHDGGDNSPPNDDCDDPAGGYDGDNNDNPGSDGDNNDNPGSDGDNNENRGSESDNDDNPGSDIDNNENRGSDNDNDYNHLLSASDVRVAVTDENGIGTNFAGADMQRPVDFFMGLTRKSDIISQTIKFTLNQEKKCSSCKTTFESSSPESVLQMPTDRKKVTDFLNRLSSWAELKDFVCPNCKEPREAIERKLIKDPSDLLVIEILLWDPSSTNKTRNFQMTALPSTNLIIGQSRYRFHAAVFHNGKGLLKQCHYTAIARSEKTFVLADDSRISECRWPRGSKDAFLLFYSRIGNVKSQSKAAVKWLTVEGAKEDISENVLARPLPSEDSKKAFKVPHSVSKKKPSVRFADEVPANGKKGVLTSNAQPIDDAKLPADRGKEADASVRDVAKAEVNRKIKASAARAPLNDEATHMRRAVAPMRSVLLPRFINQDNSCYANATLQCLLSCETLRSVLSNSTCNTALKRLATVYPAATRTRKCLTSFYVRREVRKEFIESQEDAGEFLSDLISRHVTLLENTTFYEVKEIKCDKCEAIIEVADPQTIFGLGLPNDQIHRTVTELLNDLSKYEPLSQFECPCSNVKVSAHKRSCIRLPNELLIIQLLLFKRISHTVHEKNMGFRVTTDRIITVDGFQYKLHGAVFHHGEFIDSGHYTAILNLEANFVKADDTNITMSDWPAGSEGAYLLFYHRIA